MTSVGSIHGSIRISAAQALATYASVRRANMATRTALMSTSATFMAVGTAALLAAAPIALLFKKAVTEAAQFQKKIDYFGAVTNATQADMDAVAKKAIAMSKTTVYSASQMADAFVEFGKAGISTKDIIGGVADATAALAQAADISTKDAAYNIASSMATFQLGAKDAMHIADLMAGAANASIIDVQDLAYSLKYAGGIASSVGVSFESLVTAISLLGQRGIRGSTAGTSLRQIMISLAGPTKKATELMKELGLITKEGGNHFIDATGHIKPLAQIFQILQKAEAGYTQAQQLAINKTLFNSRALSAVQILMRDGAKGFRDMQASINKVTASDVARKRLNNLAGDVQHLKNTWNTLLIQIGQPLQNFFRMIVRGLTSLVQWFGNLSPTTQKFIIYALGIVGVFLLITGVLGIFIGLGIRVIMVWRDFFFIMRLLGGVIRTAIMAFRALGMALLTNPIFLVIAAVAALVLAFIYCWTHFKGFRDFFKRAWEDIKGAFFAAWHFINRVFRDIVGAAQAVARWFMRDLVHPIWTAWRDVVGAFEAAGRGIKRAIDFIIGVISKVINFVKQHWKAIIAIILPGVGLMVDAIVTHWTAIKNFIVTVGTAIWHFLKFVWDKIYGVTAFMVRLIFNIIKTSWEVTINIAKAIWNGLVTFFTALWNGIVQRFTAAVNFIKNLLAAVWRTIGGPLKAFWHGVSAFFSAIWRGIVNIFSTAWDAIAGVFKRIGEFFATIGTAAWNGIQAAASTIYKAVSGVVGNVIDMFSGIYDSMLQVGKNLIIGIWNGISKLASWLWDKVVGFLKDIWDGIMNFFGIHSPSKKAQDEIGLNIVRGIVAGLNLGTASAITAAVRLASRIHTAMKSGADETVAYVSKSMGMLGDQVAKNLKGAQDKLKTIQDSFNQERSTVASNIISSVGFAGLGADPNGGNLPASLTNILTQYQTAADKAKLFGQQLAMLKKMGLDTNLLKELGESGYQTSGAQVTALVGATKDQIAQINATHHQLVAAAKDSGTVVASAMYDAGIKAAQGMVAGIQSQEAALLRVARAMGDSIVAEVKKALGIHSPSRRIDREVAENIMSTLANGLVRRKHWVVNAVKDVNKAMMGAHNASLNTNMNVNIAKMMDNRAAAMRWGNLNGRSANADYSVNVENLHTHNPKREELTQTLPRTIRKMSYMRTGPSR